MLFEKKVDFCLLISACNANPNGDPLYGNRPRMDFDGFGQISDVCIKRKLRNRMQDMGCDIFVQADDRCDDGAISLKERAKALQAIKDPEQFMAVACERWADVRTFGQVFAFKGFQSASVGIRGPVTIRQGVSMDPVEIVTEYITRSTSGERAAGEARSSDTMGFKRFIRYGLYKVCGSINVQLAERTGFTAEDAQLLKQCLKTLFVNDSSAARPDGTMQVVRMYWWEHPNKDGLYASAKVHRLVDAKLKPGVGAPTSTDDYTIILNELPGLTCSVYQP